MSEARIPKIAKYELTQRVGQSLLGPVFKGRHVQLSMDVTLKVLAPELMKKFPAMQERFLADARAAGRVEHPCVARVIDCGVDNQLYFVASQWAAGDTLATRLQAEGSLPPAQVVEMARDIAKGLAAAQLDGLLHRDVRPEKIILQTGQPAKLQEIGISPLNEQEIEAAVAAGGPRPTVHYTAPEVCIDPTKFDHRSDMYSLGAVMYQALAGSLPFEGASAFELMRKIVDQRPPDLRKENASLPPTVVTLVNRMMAKEPGERFSTYAALVEALEAELAGTPGANAPAADADNGSGMLGAIEPLPEPGTVDGAGGSDLPAGVPGGKRKGQTTKQMPMTTRKGTTKSTGPVSGTGRRGGVSGTNRQGAVRTGTGRHDEVAAAGSNKTTILLIAGLAIVVVLGAVAAVILMDSGKPVPPPKIDTGTGPDSGTATGTGTGSGTGTGTTVYVDPAVVAAAAEKEKAYQEKLTGLEAEYKAKSKTGDPDLEDRLEAFAQANSSRSDCAKVRMWRDQLKSARLDAAYAAACAATGAEKIALLQKFLEDFPNAKYMDDARTLLADAVKAQKTTQWKADWDALDKALGLTLAEEIDKRRQMVSDYLAKARAETGNPYIDMADKKQTAIEEDATARLKGAVDSANTALNYNQFQQAVETMTQYKLRFKDAANSPKADAKIVEIDGKAAAFWAATKKKALEKLKADVDSKSARQEVDQSLEKLKGMGTLFDSGKEYSADLKTFDVLHKMASRKEVIPNVANRAMPPILYVQGKTGLSIIEIDEKRIKMTEGGTPVTYMRNWADLSIEDRLVAYEYLLQPDGEDMPKETQALIDKARALSK